MSLDRNVGYSGGIARDTVRSVPVAQERDPPEALHLYTSSTAKTYPLTPTLLHGG